MAYDDDLDQEISGQPRDRRERRRPRDDDSGMGDDDSRGPRRGPRRKEDYFAVNAQAIDYKDADTLRRFMTERGKIRPRRQTGLNSKHQRILARQIKRARHLALLPFTDHSRS